MKLAIDVYYFDNKAKAVGVIFQNWYDPAPTRTISIIIEEVEEYESGLFYKRELPCIIELLKQIDIGTLDIIVIDGYVYLDDNQKKGLGAHLYHYLNEQISIIGVAKTPFYLNKKYVDEIFRGNSTKPLFISAIGVELLTASEYILMMDGAYRMPTLLSILDQKTKLLP